MNARAAANRNSAASHSLRAGVGDIAHEAADDVAIAGPAEPLLD